MGPHNVTWDEAMIRCRLLIQGLDPKRDVLVALPGWTESRGSREEVALAAARDIPVLTVLRAMEGAQ
jgi:hypothetical protein